MRLLKCVGLAHKAICSALRKLLNSLSYPCLAKCAANMYRKFRMFISNISRTTVKKIIDNGIWATL